jgi:bifunctional non-homologous end joining protein LigD
MSKCNETGPLRFIVPMQPVLVDEPPEHGEWSHEIKWDGYRTQIILQNGSGRAFTRRGRDWTLRYPHIIAEALLLPCRTAIIDGEVILSNPAGASDFAGLQAVIARQPERLTFVAFDLLHLNGLDLRHLPCSERRERLTTLIGNGSSRIKVSQVLPGSAAAVFAVAEAAGLEGIVSKRAGSFYRSGRTGDWLKLKAFEEAEFELVGIKRERGKPAIAILARGGRYAGNAFINFRPEIRERLWRCVEANSGPQPKTVRKKDSASTEWLRPGIVGRVRFLKGEKSLRHATLVNWRDGDVYD